MIDEVNRASPRTQSAFLQAMEEKEISISGKNFSLPRPFLVLATQTLSNKKVHIISLKHNWIDF